MLGGLKPASDLDVLVVMRRRTTRDEKRRLAERLLSISGRRSADGRWRRIELTIVAAPDLNPWRCPPRIDFLYGDWLRAPFERGELEPWEPRADRDLTVLLAMVLGADTALFGPPPAAILAPVPHADVVGAMEDDVDALVADLGSDTANVLLTLARIWSTVATGEFRSKDGAAEWVLERLPEDEHGVLRRACAVYRGTVEDRWEEGDPAVAAAARRLVEEIRKARPSRRR